MNISKNHLELLITKYLSSESGIIQENDSKRKVYFGDLIVNLSLESKRIEIHFILQTESKKSEYKSYEVIEFSLNSKTEQSKEYLTELQEKTHVEKNCLYNIIEILKES